MNIQMDLQIVKGMFEQIDRCIDGNIYRWIDKCIDNIKKIFIKKTEKYMI